MSEVGVADSYASYDAATGKYQAQTRQQFYDSLTADIEKALAAGVLEDPPAEAAKPPAKSLREIQAEEEAAKVEKAAAMERAAAAATAEYERQERIQREKAAAEAAWNADRAARDAAGHKPCWICWQYAGETQHHAPTRYKCPLNEQLFYVWDRHGNPFGSWPARRHVVEYLEERKQERRRAEAAAAKVAAAEAARAAEMAALIAAAQKPVEKSKAGKKAKKQTVEKFSLDEI